MNRRAFLGAVAGAAVGPKVDRDAEAWRYINSLMNGSDYARLKDLEVRARRIPLLRQALSEPIGLSFTLYAEQSQ